MLCSDDHAVETTVPADRIATRYFVPQNNSVELLLYRRQDRPSSAPGLGYDKMVRNGYPGDNRTIDIQHIYSSVTFLCLCGLDTDHGEYLILASVGDGGKRMT